MAGRFSVETIFKGVDKLTRPVGKMQKAIGRFSRRLTDGVERARRQLKNLKRDVDAVGGRFIALGSAILSGALFTGVAGVNKKTAEINTLADSVGASVPLVKALAGEIAEAGFNSENVIDLFEEMNNKLGESKGLEEVTAVKESLKILGLRFKDIENLSPEDQFKAIADAALKMNDAQEASAALDILMGAEANRIIAILRQRGDSIDELIDRQNRLNFMTEDATNGASAFTRAWGDTKRILSSIVSLIAGLVGEHLTPLIDKMNEWLIANKELINSKINEWLSFLVDNFQDIVKWGKRIFIAASALWALSFAIGAVNAVLTVFNALMLANPVGLYILAIAALILAAVWLYKNWDRVKQLLSDMWAKIVQAYEQSRLKKIIDWLINAADRIAAGFAAIPDAISGLFSDDDGGVSDRVNRLDPMRAVIPVQVGGVSPHFGTGLQPNTRQPEGRAQQTTGAFAANSNINGEIVIRDESGRAEVTEQPTEPNVNISVEETGGI